MPSAAPAATVNRVRAASPTRQVATAPTGTAIPSPATAPARSAPPFTAGADRSFPDRSAAARAPPVPNSGTVRVVGLGLHGVDNEPLFGVVRGGDGLDRERQRACRGVGDLLLHRGPVGHAVV